MSVGQKELFVTFQVEKSDYFRRDEADVHTDAEISLSQALLGGTIKIQGVYEDHFIQVSFYLINIFLFLNIYLMVILIVVFCRFHLGQVPILEFVLVVKV